MEVKEGILRYVKKQKSQNQQMSHFPLLCQRQFAHISILVELTNKGMNLVDGSCV